MYDPYADFTKSVLQNRLEVHSQLWNRPWIIAEFVVHSGAREDEDEVTLPGLAHFVEHTVSRNILDLTYRQAKDLFESDGGTVKFGRTTYLATRYKVMIRANPDTFREALAIFGSMLLGARLHKAIELQRNVILREFNGRYPFIESLKWDMGIRKALFGDHRLGTWNRSLGRPEGFLSVIETHLQEFYDRYYVPANISLVIVGGLRTHEVLTVLEQSPFGIPKEGMRNPIPQPLRQIPIPAESGRTVRMVDFVNFKVDYEYKAVWALPADFPRQALRVFNRMLRQILFDEIREELALTYKIKTKYTNFHDVYEYEISVQIDPAATARISELVPKCISLVPLTRDLFERTLRSCRQECMMLDLSGADLVRNAADDLMTYHRVIPAQEIWDDLHKVTHEQIVEAASFLSPEQQYTFIAYP